MSDRVMNAPLELLKTNVFETQNVKFNIKTNSIQQNNEIKKLRKTKLWSIYSGA